MKKIGFEKKQWLIQAKEKKNAWSKNESLQLQRLAIGTNSFED